MNMRKQKSEYRISIIDNCFDKNIEYCDKQKEMIQNKPLGLLKDNSGIGVVEIVLILVVLVALVIIFKDKIIEIVTNAFSSISSDVDTI